MPYNAPVPTATPAIKNGPLISLAEGNGTFYNWQLALLVFGVPYFVKRAIPLVCRGGWGTYFFVLLLCGGPVTFAYWHLMSKIGGRINDKVQFPNKGVEAYLDIKDAHLRKLYHGQKKIPMQVFHDAFFEGKIDVKGDMLDILESRHDWASFEFTFELFKYVITVLIPDVVMHSAKQDEDQVRDHYDRGDDFYGWFLGPRMIYTSGVVTTLETEETLEQLQDNKMLLVCTKLNLQPTDRLLDIGCGWGTLTAYAAKNFGCDATGVTLSRNQTKFGNDRIAANGVDPSKARIICTDFRDAPGGPGSYTKIVSLEMAEHVGIRRYGQFLRQVYDLLDDDGIFVFQVAGIRPSWQYEDLIWGLFMNKYVFPGADASCSLGWVVNHLEAAGFEVKNIDVLGVHYSATLWRWYKNWLSNKEKVLAAYGDKWYRTWEYFLAASVIASRQGSASLFQFTLHKNLNGYQRINGVPSHASIHVKPSGPVSEII